MMQDRFLAVIDALLEYGEALQQFRDDQASSLLPGKEERIDENKDGIDDPTIQQSNTTNGGI